MKKLGRLSILAALLLVISVAASRNRVHAATTEVSTMEELQAAVSAGAEAKMIQDISGELTVGTQAILDLNGFVIEGNIKINRGGILTITDSDPASAHASLTYTDPIDKTMVHEVKGGAVTSGIDVSGGKLVLDAGTVTHSSGIKVTSGSFVMSGGTIAGCGTPGEYEAHDGTWQRGGPVYVSGRRSSFTMTGGTITCNTGINKYNFDQAYYEDTGICITEDATFTMEGGSITRNVHGLGGGVALRERGTFIMKGGEISGNLAQFGGGVNVELGTFRMLGGSLADNTAAISGGGVGTELVYLLWSITQEGNDYYLDFLLDRTLPRKMLLIEGGSITGNRAEQDGGGLFLSALTSLTLSGGASVTDNSAGVNGGGIGMGAGTLTLNMEDYGFGESEYTFVMPTTVDLENCVISGNTAEGYGGGVFLRRLGDPPMVTPSGDSTFYPPDSHFAAGANTVISENRSAGSGTQKADNVYLLTDARITVSGDLSGTSIGVSSEVTPTENAPIVFTKNLSGNGSDTNFSSDDPLYGVRTNTDGEAVLGYYTYDVTLSSNGPGRILAKAEGATGLSGLVPGMTVTVTAVPDAHAELKSLTAGTATGDVTIQSLGEGKYSFAMPPADVQLSAVFKLETFTVKFVNEDGTELQSGDVEYGKTPAYTGETPTKADEEYYSYSFEKWSPDIVPVTGDATYTAVYTATEKPAYTVSEGGDAEVTQGAETDIVITVKRLPDDTTCFSHFTGVQIDGSDLAAEDYEAKAGSTVVTLKAATLQKLSVRTHTVKVNFDDGTVETSLTVTAASTEPDATEASTKPETTEASTEHETTPDTGDGSKPGLWISLAALSVLGCGAVLCVRKRSGESE